jgi:NADH-quinone oxidoreductase subunit B
VASAPGVVVSLANLGLELEAAIQAGLLVRDDDAPLPDRTLLLVSGTVTEALAPAVEQAAGGLDGDVRVLSIGACATSGGPYWDAPMVVSGVDRVVSVSSYVPGCPPRPEALVAAITEAARA